MKVRAVRLAQREKSSPARCCLRSLVADTLPPACAAAQHRQPAHGHTEEGGGGQLGQLVRARRAWWPQITACAGQPGAAAASGAPTAGFCVQRAAAVIAMPPGAAAGRHGLCAGVRRGAARPKTLALKPDADVCPSCHSRRPFFDKRMAQEVPGDSLGEVRLRPAAGGASRLA